MSMPLIWPIKSVNDTNVAVETGSTPVVAANPARADLELVNDSNQPIYLARGNAAVLNEGIRINKDGGSYSMNNRNLFLGAIYAIAQGGAKNLTISEGSWK